MKTTKKLLAAMLILALVMPVAGCSGSGSENKKGNKNTSVGTNNSAPQDEVAEDRDFFIEEQEVYNENGICITVDEQPVSSTIRYTITCDWEYGAGVDVSEVYVNGELIYESESMPHHNQFPSNEPYDTSSYLGGDIVLDRLDQSTSDENELSLSMVVEDPWQEQREEFTVTIPLVAKAGD